MFSNTQRKKIISFVYRTEYKWSTVNSTQKQKKSKKLVNKKCLEVTSKNIQNWPKLKLKVKMKRKTVIK